MEMISPTERVVKLRQATLHNPVFERSILFFRPERVNLLFAEGWSNAAYVPTMMLRRAYAENYVLRNMPAIINPDELIVGCPDYSKLNKDELLRSKKVRRNGIFVPGVYGLSSHMSLDFEKLLKIGINGLVKEIKEHRFSLDLNIPENIAKDEFYQGCLVELEGLLVMANRYVEHARFLAKSALPKRAIELKEIAKILEQVPAKPARTFREALQSIHFYLFMLELIQIGRPDQYLLPYYQADIKAGRLTQESALELIDCFSLLYSWYVPMTTSIGFMIGGRDKNGVNVANDLTRLFLQSIGHVRMAYPSIGLCVNKETPDDILNLSVKLLSEGCSHPALFNDDVIIKGLLKLGLPKEDARDYVHSCCVEITPCAKSGIWICSPYHNLMGVFMELLCERVDFNNIDELFTAYTSLLRNKVEKDALYQNRMQMERFYNGGETLRASCLVHNCLETGKSIDQGGAVYNYIMPNFVGMANLVDSFTAIDFLVFKEKKITLVELVQILKDNYKGNESIRRRIINKLPHYGNNESYTDKLAQRITKMIAHICDGLKTFRETIFVPALFSYLEHERLGKQTMATPDGRLAGSPLADGTSPIQGRDKSGPTATILSLTCWDHTPFIGGIAVNLKFGKKQMMGGTAIKVKALIKTFMERGGFELQINCVSRDTLIKARKNPENYGDLLVRIGGYSDYFTRLSSKMQNEIIYRTEHVL
jgi:formate C-acetyltransferase